MRTVIIEGFPNYTIREDGEIRNIKTNRILKHIKGSRGYTQVSLYVSAKVYLNKSVHRLMMIHFVENNNNYPEINHIDGNKENNSLSNLEWCTHSHNIRHAVDTGLKTSHVQREKVSKKVIDKATGIIYSSIKNAAIAIGIDRSVLNQSLLGNCRNKTTLVYYTEDK